MAVADYILKKGNWIHNPRMMPEFIIDFSCAMYDNHMSVKDEQPVEGMGLDCSCIMKIASCETAGLQ